ncbi:MAG TPA: hypothetical protein VMY37_18350 [Thermoguttaceae bacterium]|nr:hypothetical protein [Thermoguttaceae bacterium]
MANRRVAQSLACDWQEAILVDLVRSLASKRIVRSRFIVPRNDHGQLVAKRFATKRNQRQPGKHLLPRQEEPFHEGDTAVFADRTEARLDVLAITPGLEILAGPELRTSVADEMLRLGCTGGDGSPEKRANGNCARFRFEYGDAHDASRAMIHYGGYPPAEGPTRWQGKW